MVLLRRLTPSIPFLVAACAGGQTRQLPADAPAEASAAHTECSTRSAAEKQDCYEDHLLEILEASGVRRALLSLEAIGAADRDVERDGHVYTHLIGIEAFSPGEPVGEVFAECSTLFQSGCYHGVIQAHFMSSGVVDEKTVNALCESYQGPEADRWLLFQCLHGMGHGLTMYFSHDLPRALVGCDLLESGWDRESCYGGAFMENITNATMPHHPAAELAGVDDVHGHEHADAGTETGAHTEAFVPLRDDDPHYPCSTLDSRYGTACYGMQTSLMLWLNEGDIGDAARSCGEAPERWRATCFQSLGRDISSRTLQDPDESLRECRQAPAEYRDWCYVGLVKNFVDLTASTESGFAFCRRVEEEYKPRCNEALGEEIAVLRQDLEQRREMCRAAESEELVQRCLYGARVSS